MAEEGVSVFRFNFSHGTLADHQRMLDRVRLAQRTSRRRVHILQDLAGPRIRTGRLSGGRPVALKAGQRLMLYRKAVAGTAQGISLDYPGAFHRILRNQMIYVDDGSIHLRVIRAGADRLATEVIEGGILGERKGVNVPGAPLDFPPVSEKDIRDLRFAILNRVEYVAQSFVRSAEDVLQITRRLARSLPHAQVIAKIENRDGVRNIAAILRAAGGIMVARGDLGISLPIYEIPILQKWIIAACNHLRKPVITATQMMEHMREHPLPTRAEVNDVANAVIDGSDFVMLSGETATGRYPVETVRMMRTIIEHTERHAPFRGVRRMR
jgi:pyruvate kinase